MEKRSYVVQFLCREIWQHLLKLHIHLSSDLAISLLEIHPRKTGSNVCTRLFTIGLFVIAEGWKSVQLSINEELVEQIKKHPHNKICSCKEEREKSL